MPAFKKKKCSERISRKISQRTWNVRLKFHSRWLSRLQFTQGMSQTTHCLKCPGFTLALHRQAVICNQTALLCLCFWGLGLEHGLFLQNERWLTLVYAPWILQGKIQLKKHLPVFQLWKIEEFSRITFCPGLHSVQFVSRTVWGVSHDRVLALLF